MQHSEVRKTRMALFGHFDSSNFGNESTLQAAIYNIRRFVPGVALTCISTGPEATVATHHIDAIAVSETSLQFWIPHNRLTEVLKRLCIGLVESYSWIKGVLRLRRFDILIVPGTGLVTDAYGLLNWGPYNLFKWCAIAKICGCKLVFISIGAGPIYTPLGKRLIRAALSLADFRSYRDAASMAYLKGIGFDPGPDKVFPDLAFSLPPVVTPFRDMGIANHKVVGLGVMGYAWKYSTSNPSDSIFENYLEQLAIFLEWLLNNGYAVRLLIGDLGDERVKEELINLLNQRLPEWDTRRVINEPINSVEDLLSQIAATDIVVATRFHNVLLSLLSNKPVISISFHHKCESLMRAMDLEAYCVDINDLEAQTLIQKFRDLDKNADEIKLLIDKKTRVFRDELDEQYKLILNYL